MVWKEAIRDDAAAAEGRSPPTHEILHPIMRRTAANEILIPSPPQPS
jgi:hypothetical protein